MRPRGLLMIEHRLIEKVLLLVRREIDRIDDRNVVNEFFLQSVVDFIRTYADRTHHGKEEDILFELLKTKSLDPQDRADMGELVEEHENARHTVADLLKANAAYLGGDQTQVRVIREKMLFLTEFYPVHIAKEDKVFFPKADRYFSDDEQARLLDAFYVFDRGMIHEKYNKVYELLSHNEP